ncbi:transmembrane amino acid transporter protein [Besnoitia besnoiti]|uniref:Transmembrane amino acid transporter protein n=1 Tax=Besnoitia besnoiti TaxID=94643 RepID=A0A2A9MAX9_BESBE|nr:transmembrane amino acid transporter protein [Besnoitia besnoiti]PFH35039.1 transmembrane amino acid transporter protein [Besnoitia besnoiti]
MPIEVARFASPEEAVEAAALQSRETLAEERQDMEAGQEGQIMVCLASSSLTEVEIVSSSSMQVAHCRHDSLLATTATNSTTNPEGGNSTSDLLKEASNRPTGKTTGAFGTSVIICKAFMGSVFIFLPYAVMKGGLVLSLLTLAGVLLLSLYCMHLLIQCCEQGVRDTYEVIAEYALGKWGRTLVEACVFLSQVSFCSVYAVVASRNLLDVIQVASGCSSRMEFPVTYMIWALSVYFLPLSFVRNMSYLVPLMLAGNLGTLVGMLILIVAVLVHMGQNPTVHTFDFFNFDGWSVVLGTGIYLWLGAGLILPIRNTAKPSVQRKFSALLTLSLAGLLALYVVYTTICILAFGKDLKEIILSNLPAGPLGATIQAIFVVVVLSTYPLMLFPATGIVEERLSPYVKNTSVIMREHVSASIRVLLVTATLAMATVGKNHLGGFVSLVGAVCGVPLAFVFPALVHLKLKAPRQFRRRLPHYLIIVLGFAAQLFSVYYTISRWRPTADYVGLCQTATPQEDPDLLRDM